MSSTLVASTIYILYRPSLPPPSTHSRCAEVGDTAGSGNRGNEDLLSVRLANSSENSHSDFVRKLFRLTPICSTLYNATNQIFFIDYLEFFWPVH